jgi:thioredoxin 1
MKYLETKSELEEFLSNPSALLVIGATWCRPCMLMKPDLEKYSEGRHLAMVILDKCDIDLTEEIKERFRIMGIPKSMQFDNGELVKETVGKLSLKEMESMFGF